MAPSRYSQDGLTRCMIRFFHLEPLSYILNKDLILSFLSYLILSSWLSVSVWLSFQDLEKIAHFLIFEQVYILLLVCCSGLY